MADTGRPTCPACGGPPGRASEFCGACWAEVPKIVRTEYGDACKAIASRPTSTKARAWHDDVVAEIVQLATRHQRAVL